MFFTFLKFYKWYQTVQRITFPFVIKMKRLYSWILFFSVIFSISLYLIQTITSLSSVSDFIKNFSRKHSNLWIIYVSTDWFACWEFRNFLNSRKSTDVFLSIRAWIRKYLVYFCMQRRFFFMLSFNHFTVMLVWIYLHLTFLIPHFHLTHLYSYVLWINNGATFVNRKGNTDCCGKAN